MKRFWLTFTGIMSFVLLNAELVWLEPVYDFGAFSEDLHTVNHVFKAVNTGTEGVSVVSSRANCGCTVASPSRDVIAAGDTLYVPVEFNAVGRPGRFTKKVFVDTSDGGKATLVVSGTVIGTQSTLVNRYPVGVGATRVSGTVVPFGSTRKGRGLAGGLNIYNSTDKVIRPRVKDLPDYLTVTFRPEQIGVGEEGFVSLNFNTSKCNEWGTVVDSFVLFPDGSNEADSIRISTVGIINEDFSKLTAEERANGPKVEIEPMSVDFGHFSGDKRVERTVSVWNRGGKPLLIRKVETAEKSVSVGDYKEKVMPGKCVRIKLTLDTEKVDKEQPLNGKLQIITNAPESSNVAVRLVGTH